MKSFLPLFFTLFSLTVAFGQDFSGHYTGTYNGDNVNMTIESAGPGHWSGLITDSQQEYKVTASNQGSNLTGTATCESLGISFDLTGQLKGNTLDVKMNFLGVEMLVLFTKAGKTAPATAAARSSAMPELPAGARHDPALVGKWMHQENYNSGVGMDGYYSNNTYLAFNADGTLSDYGGETMMGSNTGSGQSSNAGMGVIPGVKWYSDKNSLYLVANEKGKTETVRLGRYYIENGALLITADNGTKVLYCEK